jgi:hypothetical protein
MDKTTVRRIFRAIVLVVSCWFGMQIPLAAQQDTLLTRYGDVLVGKIDKVTPETIKIKVKYRKDAIEIKLGELLKISSPHQYVVNDVKNKNWKGTLTLDTLHRGVLGLKLPDTVIFFTPKQVFDVAEDKPRAFKEGLRANLDFGINRIKAENSLSANLGINLSYSSRRWLVQADYSAFSNAVDTTLNYWRNGIFSVAYVLPREWFVTSKMNLYTSTEQSLDLRRNFFLGVGKIFIHRTEETLSLSGGFMSNRELYLTSNTLFNSTESYLSMHYNGKITNRWEAIFDGGVFPSLSQAGRVRSNLSMDLKYKFLNHFYLGLRYTLNTDSKPQVEASKSDYVFAIKFGWSLKKL